MLRVRDPSASLAFYTGVLGMTLLARLDFADMKFSLYFLGYEDAASIPEDPVERARWMFGRPGLIELTHNWGSESDPGFAGYHNGNGKEKGFGHIGLVVPDVAAACARFDTLGVKFIKRPDEGKMSNLGFIADPDGYWIEILTPDNAVQFVDWKGNKEEAGKEK